MLQAKTISSKKINEWGLIQEKRGLSLIVLKGEETFTEKMKT